MTDKKPLDQELNDTLGAIFDDATKEVVAEETSEEGVAETTTEEKEIKSEAQEEPATGEENTDQESVNEEAVVAPLSKAPDHWSAGAKAVWAKLDPVVRAEALKQEEFANKLQSRNALERKKYEAIDAVIEPQRNLLKANYGDEANGLTIQIFIKPCKTLCLICH